MYVWQMPIPEFDADNPTHARLVQLAADAETIADSVTLPAGKRFETHRRLIREAIAASETGCAIEVEVAALFQAVKCAVVDEDASDLEVDR